MLLFLSLTCGCRQAPPAPEATATRWYAADGLFDTDPHWVGGDGAYSVDLNDSRVLWLFGDSFVARTPYDRSDIYFLRNTAAIQHGTDPVTSPMRFHWQTTEEQPATFVDGPTPDTFLWPLHGARLPSGRLLVFYERIVDTEPPEEDEGRGPQLAFETLGWTAFLVHDVDAPVRDWVFEPARVGDTDGSSVGEAVLVEPPWLYLYATDRSLSHPVMLARVDLDDAEAGDLTDLSWWCGQSWCGDRPTRLVVIGAPELSVHLHRASGRYVMVHSLAFGPTTLGVRTAERPEGPWSKVRPVFRPRASTEHGAFVYAGKASAALSDDTVVATFVETYEYLPRFVRIHLP